MPQAKHLASVKPERRDEIVAQVIDDMNALPLAKAQVQASHLYDANGLVNVTDPLLRVALCRALAKKFAGTTAAALPYWESFQ
jgi:hypothetical protein